ncbi:MAG: ABC transporter permease [bacterium]|nr:ABC transporter permease [bacterium]MDT8396253.1 ABC transporter permease [bacterium]
MKTLFFASATIWQREVIRYLRSPSRIIGSLGMPFFFLAFLGMGLQSAFGMRPGGERYLDYIAPGIVGMVLLFSSTVAGISVIWDRQFGFLKEMLVAPIPRLAIVLGRTAGGTTTASIQALLMLGISILLGLRVPTPTGFLFILAFMALIGVSFTSLGVAMASRMEDPHGFQLIFNFLIMPIFFLSGAFFPLDQLPTALRVAAYLNPLTYGVDGLRWALLGQSAMGPALDLAVLGTVSAAFLTLGALLFRGARM